MVVTGSTVSLTLTSLDAAINDEFFGTIAQTLPTITQAATGETDFFSAKSTMIMDELAGASFTNEITETAVFTESTAFEMEWAVNEVMTLDETVEYNSELSITETMVMDERPGSIEWTTLVDADPMRIIARAWSTITLPVSSAMTIDESVIVGRTTAVLDAAVINGTLQSYGEFLNEETEGLVINGTYISGLGEDVTSVITLDDSYSFAVVAQETATGVFTADDRDVAFVETFEELSSEFTISDAVSYEGSIYNNTASDTMVIKDGYWAKDFGALAWVLNTETGGLSTYDNFGFTSLVEHEGVIYAASQEGVFALTGDTDDGRYISAQVKTGFLDFNQTQTKRISDIFVGYTGGQLEFNVETYDGPQEVYTYAMEEREADAPRNNRLKVGKGLSSRYWRFAIRNVDGADFQVYDVTAEVATSKRRL
jgi:hypothetical protein